MSLEWNSYTIGESCELITGFPFKSKYYLDEGLFKVVRGDNVKEGFIKWDDKKRCWNELNDKLKKVILKEEDIVIGMDGSKLGKNRATISKKDLPALLAQRVACVRAKEGFDQNYIKYVILSNYFKSYVDKVKTGTSIPHISLGQISEFTFEAPDYKKQKTISSILSTIDKKINVNQEINKNLQTFSKNIFKYYLEDFTPFISDKMIDSEIGSIPKNWEVYEFDSIAKMFNGYSYKGNELQPSNSAMITIKNFNRDGSFRTDGFKEIVYSDKVKKQHFVNENDVLISCTDVTQDADIIGNCILLLDKQEYNDIIMSMDLVKIESKISGINNFLLASILKSYRFKMHILGYVNGTTVLHLDKKGIKKFKLALPNDLSILKDLNSILENNYNQIAINQKEIINLEKLRDTLLPKLMSGEIDVSKINCDLELKYNYMKYLFNQIHTPMSKSVV